MLHPLPPVSNVHCPVLCGRAVYGKSRLWEEPFIGRAVYRKGCLQQEPIGEERWISSPCFIPFRQFPMYTVPSCEEEPFMGRAVYGKSRLVEGPFIGRAVCRKSRFGKSGGSRPRASSPSASSQCTLSRPVGKSRLRKEPFMGRAIHGKSRS